MSSPAIEATIERHDLPLEAPFGIARGTTETAQIVSVELHVDDDRDSQGHVGIGAATPASYYDESVDSVLAALPELVDVVQEFDHPLPGPRGSNTDDRAPGPTLAAVEDALAEARHADAAARSALSIALHDLAAKRLSLPLYRLWGLDPDDVPPTSYTIGLAERETTRERAERAVQRGHDLLKVKLGTEDDAERLAAVRDAAPDASIRVDANGGWDCDTALERLPVLEEHDVELLEQPVRATDLEGLGAVTEQASMPVAADEACIEANDVGWVADVCDAVVCKLPKCGGFGEARRQIAAARDHDLEVMLGCMVTSNAAIAGAWHLAPLVDYVDLDGAMLLAEDPYDGLPLDDGAADLRGYGTFGTGARRAKR